MLFPLYSVSFHFSNFSFGEKQDYFLSNRRKSQNQKHQCSISGHFSIFIMRSTHTTAYKLKGTYFSREECRGQVYCCRLLDRSWISYREEKAVTLISVPRNSWKRRRDEREDGKEKKCGKTFEEQTSVRCKCPYMLVCLRVYNFSGAKRVTQCSRMHGNTVHQLYYIEKNPRGIKYQKGKILALLKRPGSVCGKESLQDQKIIKAGDE